MPRRKSSPFAAPKPSYWDKLKSGTSHETYDPHHEGYGSESEWQSIFNVRMGFAEAQDVKSKSRRSWGSDWQVISDVSGVHVDENSMWSAVKTAFRKASMNCHPDRVAQTGMDPKVAEETFKEVTAAFVMLEDIYRSKNRLT
jgi:hypothetical protein